MGENTGDAAARLMIPLADGTRIVVLDSATFVDKFYAGRPSTGRDVIVNGSYAGVFSARVMVPHAPRATIGLDCGIGKDGAGVAALWYFEAIGIPAAAADTMSAEMGNGLDLYENGIISRVNNLAEDAGVRPGMRVSAAAEMIRRPIEPFHGLRTNRVVIKTNAAGRSIVCTDSIFYALTEDVGRNVLCVGGHTGLSIVEKVQSLRPWGYLMSDGGIGKNRSGLAAMPIFDDMGIPGASVSAATARMGDGRSTYFDGVVSAVNARAAAKGVRIGQPAMEAA